MLKMQESNYDLLRILCVIAVISIHVSAIWLEAASNANVLGEIYTGHLAIACLWNVLARFAVPFFIMLSGTFLLAGKHDDVGYRTSVPLRRLLYGGLCDPVCSKQRSKQRTRSDPDFTRIIEF